MTFYYIFVFFRALYLWYWQKMLLKTKMQRKYEGDANYATDFLRLSRKAINSEATEWLCCKQWFFLTQKFVFLTNCFLILDLLLQNTPNLKHLWWHRRSFFSLSFVTSLYGNTPEVHWSSCQVSLCKNSKNVWKAVTSGDTFSFPTMPFHKQGNAGN